MTHVEVFQARSCAAEVMTLVALLLRGNVKEKLPALSATAVTLEVQLFAATVAPDSVVQVSMMFVRLVALGYAL